MSLSQILATAIFFAVFALITWGKVHRYIPAMAGGILVIVVVFLIVLHDPGQVMSTLNLAQVGTRQFWIPGSAHLESQGINWQTIVFITGMMTMVEGLAQVGFFEWMCLATVKIARHKIVPIFVAFMLLSGLVSMFIDSITVMLFMATITIEISRRLKFDPVPVIIAEIFASNVGGSATMSGDPPNIIIGTSLGYTFMDFVKNTGLIAGAGLLLSLVSFYLVFRKKLTYPNTIETRDVESTIPEPETAITRIVPFYVNAGILILTVGLLVTHAQTGISVAAIGAIATILALAANGKTALKIIKKIDWRTLLFFIGLFICVGGLEATGVLTILARIIGQVSHGSLMVTATMILWISAFASSLVDNIPFAATMVPVISQLAQTQGISLHPLVWSLALGTDIGGNGTPIGASANVVGTSIAEREGYKISWGRYVKYALPIMILVIGLCNALILLMYS